MKEGDGMGGGEGVDVFRGNRKTAPGCNGFIITCLNTTKYIRTNWHLLFSAKESNYIFFKKQKKDTEKVWK